jgi:hypothetical protein
MIGLHVESVPDTSTPPLFPIAHHSTNGPAGCRARDSGLSTFGERAYVDRVVRGCSIGDSRTHVCTANVPVGHTG